MRERLKVGAAQIAPKFLDKRGTIEKIGRTLEEAGRLGLDLLVFPETFLSGQRAPLSRHLRGTAGMRPSPTLEAVKRNLCRAPAAPRGAGLDLLVPCRRQMALSRRRASSSAVP